MSVVDVYVHDLSFALGSIESTVSASAESGRTFSSARLLEGAGFERHHMCADGESVLDLAVRAVEPVRGSVEGASAIVWATCLPENASVGDRARFLETRDVKPLMDYPVSRLQSHLKAPGAIAIGLGQQACTSMLGSVRVARGLLATEPDFERVLCLTSDRFPPGAVYEQAFHLISDGAACCVVSRRPRGFKVLGCHQLTNGAAVQANDEETASVYFNYTHRLVRETVQRAGLEVSDVDWVVPQNMNRKAWQILSRLLHVDEERVHTRTLPDVAHCISGDNIINLKDLDDSGRLKAGDRVLCVMAGYGLNWQALLLEKVEA